MPIAGKNLLSYWVPEMLASRLVPGVRVVVPVGKRKITGIFVRWNEEQNIANPEKIKEILDIIDEVPVFSQDLMRLWQWAARYYLTPPGEMLSAMLPGGMLREGESIVKVKGDHAKKKRRPSKSEQTEEESRSLSEPHFFVDKLSINEKNIFAYVQEKKRVSLKTLRRRFPQVRISNVLHQLERLQFVEIRETVRSSKAAERATVDFLEDPPLQKDAYTVQLSSTQVDAHKKITAAIHADTFRVFLLHGVTGSGKTEVYLHAARTTIDKQKNVLFLVPEIALTHQFIERVQQRFGQRVAVLHSAQAAGERWAEWQRIARGEVKIVIGVRSAVFAPLDHLGLIVVDEEHDPAYKQEEGTRYNARDLAIVRGQIASCPVVLGSATPSLESYSHCQTQRYSLLELPERVEARLLPSVEIVDLRQRQYNETDAGRIFSLSLREALIENYQVRKQSVLFLNRRGYASYLQCRSCGEALSCSQCSVTLTFHLGGRVLRCHYCGFSRSAPDICPHCREPELEGSGMGTEQVEEAVRQLLPQARIARLDRDSTRKRGFLDGVLKSWRAHETDVLIGTQMVTKGHDVPGVTLVGVLLADVALNLPDFRATERTFQLLTQVAGRAGRGKEPGRVIIQTYSPQHYSIRCAAQHDFSRFATLELRYRKKLGYPPFARMVNVRFEGKDGERVRESAERFAQLVSAKVPRNRKSVSILGPAPAPIERIKGRDRWQVLLKGEDRLLLHDIVGQVQEEFLDRERSPHVRIIVDVDPYNML
ncbi:MAG: primosomal protein N' [Candidatus Binatia bacterium]